MGEALRHPFLREFHDSKQEMTAAGPITIPLPENVRYSAETYRDILYQQIAVSHPPQDSFTSRLRSSRARSRSSQSQASDGSDAHHRSRKKAKEKGKEKEKEGKERRRGEKGKEKDKE